MTDWPASLAPCLLIDTIGPVHLPLILAGVLLCTPTG